jgi:hypothetical protein
LHKFARPPNPCEYLGLFLLKNAGKIDKQVDKAENDNAASVAVLSSGATGTGSSGATND